MNAASPANYPTYSVNSELPSPSRLEIMFSSSNYCLLSSWSLLTLLTLHTAFLASLTLLLLCWLKLPEYNFLPLPSHLSHSKEVSPVHHPIPVTVRLDTSQRQQQYIEVGIRPPRRGDLYRSARPTVCLLSVVCLSVPIV